MIGLTKSQELRVGEDMPREVTLISVRLFLHACACVLAQEVGATTVRESSSRPNLNQTNTSLFEGSTARKDMVL